MSFLVILLSINSQTVYIYLSFNCVDYEFLIQAMQLLCKKTHVNKLNVKLIIKILISKSSPKFHSQINALRPRKWKKIHIAKGALTCYFVNKI